LRTHTGALILTISDLLTEAAFFCGAYLIQHYKSGKLLALSTLFAAFQKYAALAPHFLGSSKIARNQGLICK
jgi:hypothetical protein